MYAFLMLVPVVLVAAWVVMFLAYRVVVHRARSLAAALTREFGCLHCNRKCLVWYGHRWRERDGVLGFVLACSLCGCKRQLRMAQARTALAARRPPAR